MANVLPPKNRDELKKNYLLRLGTTAALVLTGAMVIGVVSLIPAYLFARGERNEIEQYQVIQGETREVSKQDNAVEIARYVRSLIEQAERTGHARAARSIELVLRDWERHANDIIISGFVFSTPDTKDAVPQVRISGEARNRAVLNTFVQTLRRDPAFSNIELPVSDLANSDETKFSVVIQLDAE